MSERRVEGPAAALARALGPPLRDAPPRRLARRFRARLRSVRDDLLESVARADAEVEPAGAAATEWIADNRHLLVRAADQILEDLTPGFFRVLPGLDTAARPPRVERLAEEIVGGHVGFVDGSSVLRFGREFQSVTALDTAELWALPPFLRLVLLERLVRAAREPADPAAGPVIAACVSSLRTLDQVDWREIVEALSLVDRCFRRLDPSRSYQQMDDDTRDRYRKAVEELARWSGVAEVGVATESVRLAAAGPPAHVGAWLVGRRRRELEAALGVRPPWGARLRRILFRHAGAAYFGLVGVVAAVVLALALSALAGTGTGRAWIVVSGLLVALPALSVGVAVANALLTRMVPPRRLPKLDFSTGVPPSWRTCVAVPVIFNDIADVGPVLRRLETNYRGNADDNLVFALLADPRDADSETADDDAAIIEAAAEGIRALNRRFGRDGVRPFLLFVRPRRWNPREGRWMARERKRGKLQELNRLLLGDDTVDLTLRAGDAAGLDGVSFVLTLDADTFLPRGAAAGLVGTLAHPLNRPRFDAEGRVVAGYTVLQPRVETVGDRDRTWFMRIFEADEGLDLYSHAASDLYQDLFGTGVFVGKGLYDVAAFERSLADRVPDNALLSHDLFEGAHGRAALVSDMTVLEDFPSTPAAWMRRRHRWVRGDWQLLPWLLPRVPSGSGAWIPNRLSGLARWMIADNLVRSLVFPSLFALAVLGSLLPTLPGWWWGGWVVGFAGVPVALAALGGIPVALRRSRGRAVFRNARGRLLHPLGRWCAAIVFLPWQAALDADAVARTLYRVLISRRHLLEWTSAAHTSRALAGRGGLLASVVHTGPGLVPTAALGALAVILPPGPSPWTVVLVAVWLGSPAASWMLGRPRVRRRERLEEADRIWLRCLARRTWTYFERLLTPEDQWLPPDNLQLEPDRGVAHRTSPTNIGLGVLSIAAAHDFGHLTLTQAAATLASLLDSVEHLERHRGHLLNWYDTRNLQPLAPRYVSSVDSGNLAASLIAVVGALDDFERTRFPRPADVLGLADTMEVTAQVLRDAGGAGSRIPAELLRGAANDLRSRASEPERLPEILAELGRDVVPRVDGAIATLLEEDPAAIGTARIGEVRGWMETLHQHLVHLDEEVRGLLPWRDAMSRMPPALAATRPTLFDGLPERVSLVEAGAVVDGLRESLTALRDRDHGTASEVTAWIDQLDGALEGAGERIRGLRAELAYLRASMWRLVDEMDFRFLHDEARELLHVGYNVDAATLDRSHYDLYASEARLASYIGMAKGDLPTEHWLRLGRPFARRDGSTLLLSWAGTMFEYLMPTLFLRTPEGSLSEVAGERAVASQIEFGRRSGVPWGISESAYAEVDAHGHYRYRAFGVPDLALRHDPADDLLVVAPYASALALTVRPVAAVRNLRRLAEAGLLGPTGLMEALDFGSPGRGGRRPRIVRSVMAHHQGMTLAAIHHTLTDASMSRRFHRDSALAALAYLLHEEAPGPVRTSAAPPSAPRRALPARAVAEPPWRVDPAAFPPATTVLSNGSLSTLLTATGSGGLRWKGRDVLRWRPDPTAQDHGLWIYVRNVADDLVRSCASAPTWSSTHHYEAVFAGESVEFHRDDGPLKIRTTVAVSPAADVEIRRVTIVNEGDRDATLELTSFAEVALAPPAEDRRHPAFARLFVEAELGGGPDTLVFRRRAEGLDDEPMFAAHAVTASEGELVRWETDRSGFLARGGDLRRPRGVEERGSASAERGPWAPLDPVASLTWRMVARAARETSVTFLTAAGPTRRSVLEALETHGSPGAVQWALDLNREEARRSQQEMGLHEGDLPAFQRLFTALVFPYHPMRAPAAAATPTSSGDARDGLWSIGVSGDLPVAVVRAPTVESTALLSELIRAHAYWETLGASWDLVVLGGGGEDTYGEPVGGWLRDLLGRVGRSDRLDRPGGIHWIADGRVPPRAVRRIEAAASVFFPAPAPSLAAALEGLEHRRDELPPFVPVPSGPVESYAPTPLEQEPDLDFFNGIGGFRRDETAYVLHLEPGQRPPAPWINVVADERFGFLVSEGGTGCTWDGNSGERRLTPWSNDAVLDPASDAIHLRDEETGEVWSPTPAPAGDRAPCRVVHRPGSTTFLKRSQGLEQEVRLDLAEGERARVDEVRLKNLWPRPRRITVTRYVDWVLGPRRSITGPHVVTAFDRHVEAIVAHDRFQAAPIGFLASDARVHGFTCDRTEYLGPEGRRDIPAGLSRIGLAGATGSELDPCGALQIHVDLAPGEERRVRFFLGAVDRIGQLPERLARLRDEEALARRREATTTFWADLLGRTTVRTPEPSMDLMLNGWLRYQALACRLWGRSGFHQASGAYGFRDQLQDGLGLLDVMPSVCRERILDAASRQFVEGDVLHWWHPHTDHGVRTRCSDDLVWLPFVVAAYVRRTGDEAVLREEIPFLEAPPLEPDEIERYGAFEPVDPPASLYEHCLRALDRAGATSPRGVPLIGAGDWNDGLNRVGIEGRGESFWLGWFLGRTCLDYARICERRGEVGRAQALRERAGRLASANEAHGWDGAWYRRATYDDGTPLGSKTSVEGVIDSLSQSWSLLSGLGDVERAEGAMEVVWQKLVDPTSRLVLLLDPPFHDTPRQPGYIKSYPPGVRENGGQYTHAGAWVGWAYALLGDGDRAEETFRLLNPILHATSPEAVEHYRVEPYVVAGDVYGGEHHRGRGGWTWYTGSASWLYRLGAEAILGLRFEEDTLRIDPCIPRSWKRFLVEHRHGTATYHILVGNPSGVSRGIRSVVLDGEPLSGPDIPLEDDGEHHHVVVTLGHPGRPSATPRGEVP